MEGWKGGKGGKVKGGCGIPYLNVHNVFVRGRVLYNKGGRRDLSGSLKGARCKARGTAVECVGL